jgi:hypothetical protein
MTEALHVHLISDMFLQAAATDVSYNNAWSWRKFSKSNGLNFSY